MLTVRYCRELSVFACVRRVPNNFTVLEFLSFLDRGELLFKNLSCEENWDEWLN
jgi:hypothetical protein